MGGYPTFDDAVRAAVLDGRTPLLDGFFGLVTHLGDTWAIVVFSLVLVYALGRAGRRRQAWVVAVAMVSGAGLLVQGLKYAIGRVRPPAVDALIDLPHSASWPSGHAFAALLLGLLVVWVIARSASTSSAPRILAGGLVLVFALLVGVSRVYLGVHWASDVIAGWVLAVGWFGFALGMSRLVERRDAPTGRERPTSRVGR